MPLKATKINVGFATLQYKDRITTLIFWYMPRRSLSEPIDISDPLFDHGCFVQFFVDADQAAALIAWSAKSAAFETSVIAFATSSS